MAFAVLAAPCIVQTIVWPVTGFGIVAVVLWVTGWMGFAWCVSGLCIPDDRVKRLYVCRFYRLGRMPFVVRMCTRTAFDVRVWCIRECLSLGALWFRIERR